MQADIAGAFQIARLAARFDWTWSPDDVPRFCDVAEWQFAGPSARAGISTNLEIARPVGFVSIGREVWDDASQIRVLRQISVEATSSDLDLGTGPTHATIDAFALAASLFVSEWGDPARTVPGSSAKLAWDLPCVVIQVEIDKSDLVLSLINPHYEQWIESCSGEAEADWRRYHGDERPSDAVSPSLAGGWTSFADALALTLSRLPEEGQLTLVAGSDHWLRFSFGTNSRYGLLLKCEFPRVRGIDSAEHARTGWAKPDRRNRNWAKRITWPAPFDGYHSLAQDAVAVLRDMFGVDDPTSISVHSRSSSYEEPASLEAFKGN
ncbi:DUF6301 family protein [Nocardia sp. NPDC004151]|uniref:DUF6301 family protein n=1 Tax=Nocardia sp. NPDC004151 TaxID=3364304 RepID=UPI0036736CD7